MTAKGSKEIIEDFYNLFLRYKGQYGEKAAIKLFLYATSKIFILVQKNIGMNVEDEKWRYTE